jgi:hypothetical protein
MSTHCALQAQQNAMTNRPVYGSNTQQYFLPNQALLLIEHLDVLANWI